MYYKSNKMFYIKRCNQTKYIKIKTGISILVLLLLSTSCGKQYLNRLAAHQNLLSQTAINKMMSPEEKMDVLANSFVNMMHESLDVLNPKKGTQFIQDFAKQNEKSIDAIFKDIAKWQSNMTDMEKVTLGLKMIRKPYARKLIELVPRFERKFNNIALASRLTGKLKNGLINLGKQKLKLGQ